MARALAKKVETSTTLLEAAKKVLRQNGHSGLSTRDVAAAAGVPLSQIHYHFGSKQGLMLALFDYLNAQLLDRQNAMFHDTTLSLSQRWDRACDYLDEDIASGYVRVLQELIAASWSDPEVAKVVRAGLMGWFELIADVARQAEKELGGLGPFSAEEVAALMSSAFIGGESLYPAGRREEGCAGAPVAAARRRRHSYGREQIIQEVMPCAPSCRRTKGSPSATATASTTRSTVRARRPWSSCRPGASSIRASTRRRSRISANASAASPTTRCGNGQ